MSTQITLITKTDTPSLMSKRITIGPNQRVQSDGSHCIMRHGSADPVVVSSAAQLADIIHNCRSDQAIALGALQTDITTPACIVTQSSLKKGSGNIARTREYIDYLPGQPAYALIDIDNKGMPGHVKAVVDSAGGVWPALVRLAPGLATASRVSRASTSSGLRRIDTGEEFAGNGGSHHYVLVQDGRDIARMLKDLHDRCWLEGLGWHVIGASGQLLERSVVDVMVGYGERLCFEGQPDIQPPLAQDQQSRRAVATEGIAINSSVIVPRLTEFERSRLREAKQASIKSLDKQASEVRAEHDQKLAEKVSQRTGRPVAFALRQVSARHRGVLFPDFELDFDYLGVVTVHAVLANAGRFVGETLADPLEGPDYGRCKAKVMQADDGTLFIHSFAHGRGIYHLRHDIDSAKSALDKTPKDGGLDFAMAVMRNADLADDEVVDFTQATAAATKLKPATVRTRIATERKKAHIAQQRARMDASADGRIIRPRPRSDEELTPTVQFLDQLLAADTSEEPPMRDASGNLVEVRVREPWDMHTLSADGTNSVAQDVMQAPAEPMLVALTLTQIEMQLERFVVFEVQGKDGAYPGALGRLFIEALLQHAPSSIPVVRAINTAPLVAMSGRVIEGVGLDRANGLLHRIDPLLRGCVPTSIPTEAQVKEAMDFLLNHWLVDVALTPEEKCVVVMLALTMIERPLLPERPAFFITAGQRGGGKTTLVQMLTLAVFGRRAAAAGWSEHPEERKKALFSYLRQGVAVLVWDNIPRGLSISCPHIEASLTMAEIADRVLGVSKIETAPSTSVQIFTGNSITPRGDMASRSLMVQLNVERPDPENRRFEHADPFDWSERHRPEILRALYTVLLFGSQGRPSSAEAKTRFKTWWRLVGWPVERAASLLDIHVDCTELMRAGEENDEDATAASNILIVLYRQFGGSPFTSGDIVKALVLQSTRSGIGFASVTPQEEDRVAALTEALEQISDRRLYQPSAHAIGKLLQKRLVDRPAWFDDSGTVATLRRQRNHEANAYRIELRKPPRADDGKNGNTSPRTAQNIPRIPDNPDDEDWDAPSAGNVGVAGNVSATGSGNAAKNQLSNIDEFKL